jgi:CRISPR-associated Csx2 family protein
MTRKVFISFLGTSNYKAIRYVEYAEEVDVVSPLRFVQEALLNRLQSILTVNDQIYIFCTNGALANWEDGEHENQQSKEMEWHEGLKSRIEKLHLPCLVETVPIPDGQSQDELWQIYQVVFDLLREGDQVYFDITHGFRSLPMLNTVLIDYAKLLKGIEVKAIYYGAFEAREKNNGVDYAPIWNLYVFNELQEWTTGASQLLTAGDAKSLSRILHRNNYEDVANLLYQFTSEIKTCRLNAIVQGKTAVLLSTKLDELQESKNILKPLKPLLMLLSSHFKGYKSNNLRNGVLAVEWCIEHQLVQQGYTFMSDLLLSLICQEIGVNYLNYHIRAAVGFALKQNPSTSSEFRYSKSPKIKLSQIRAIESTRMLNNIEMISECQILIDDKRHDMNHSGLNKDPEQANILTTDLVSTYEFFQRTTTQIK